MAAVVAVIAALGIILLAALFISWRSGLITMRNFCCIVAVALFVLAAVLAFDTDHQFVTIQGQGNIGPIVVANMVRGLAALGFCLGGGCSIIGAALSRSEGPGTPARERGL
jgi:hypothetical protein